MFKYFQNFVVVNKQKIYKQNLTRKKRNSDFGNQKEEGSYNSSLIDLRRCASMRLCGFQSRFQKSLMLCIWPVRGAFEIAREKKRRRKAEDKEQGKTHNWSSFVKKEKILASKN